jgi:serine protease Do
MVATGQGFTVWPWNRDKDKKTASTPIQANVQVSTTPLTRDARLGTSFAPVVEKVTPSVVTINTTRTQSREEDMAAMNPLFQDPFFRRFFGDAIPQQRGPAQPLRGLGSGVIMTADGIILTNHHVVAGSDEILVSLPGSKKPLPARLIGSDPRSDVAVLKIDATNLPAITVSDSDQARVGDVVLAVGNPFGVGQTVTMGIISAVGRSVIGLIDYGSFIQTDAAINPGNSGGALVDAEGRLIGINTAIFSRSGGNIGIGFAIPANLARNIMDRILKDGRVIRGYLGVTVQDLREELARSFGLKDDQGALVSDLDPAGAGQAAGIKPGDVIVSFNGTPVTDSRTLRSLVGNSVPGARVTLGLVREGKKIEVQAVLKELPASDEEEPSVNTSGPAASTKGIPGVAVQNLQPQLRNAFRIPDSINGVVITQVDPSSPAYESGLRPGDVVLEVNRQPVASVADYTKAAAKTSGNAWILRVWSRGTSRFVVVEQTPAP